MESTDHVVLVWYSLSDDAISTEAERWEINALELRLTKAVEAARAGDFDGELFGDGEAVLYAYGPDAAKLFAATEPPLRACPLRPAHTVLRFGPAEGHSAPQYHIEL